MKLDVNETGNIVLGEVFNPLILKTEDGFEIAIYMRDDGFEMGVEDINAKVEDRVKVFSWYSINPGEEPQRMVGKEEADD